MWAARKFGPFQQAASGTYALFRKAWMRVPIQLTAFAAAFYVSSQLQTRIFPKFSWQNWKPWGGIHEGVYLHNQDLISRFRFFENGAAEAQGDAKMDVESYIDKYTSGPQTKAQLLTRVADGKAIEDEPMFEKF